NAGASGADPMTRPLGGEFSPAIADCGYRAPLTPRLARPLSLYRHGGGHRVAIAQVRGRNSAFRPAQRDARSGSHARLHVNRGTVRLDDPFDQREAHTGSTETARRGVVHLEEALEDVRHVAGRDADPLIDDL